MNLSKLKKIHVIIIGSVVCVLAGVAIFFLVIKPQREAFAAAEARYNAAVTVGNAIELDKAEKDVVKAGIEVAQAQQMLDVQMRKRMPDLSFARRDLGMLALWREQINTLGPLLQHFAQDPKVQVLASGFNIPAPPVNPNDKLFAQPILEYQIGGVAAMGNFKELMDNVRRWNNCRRLVMVGPPQVGGISPRLVVSYNLTCYIFPAETGGPNIPLAGGGDQTAQAQ